MSMDQSLFGDDEPAAPESEPTAAPIRDWQIDLIRNALDAHGLVSMDKRQALIEDVAGRPVASLREMTHDEAMVAISKLGDTAPVATAKPTSLWDSREDDTWIDRL